MAAYDSFVLNWPPAMLSEKMSVFSAPGCGVVTSVSSLILRLDTDTVAESLLVSLLRPIRPILPSFSIATNAVRTVVRGRGDAPGEGLARPPETGDLPLSGRASPFCSNMARRFLTPDMMADTRVSTRFASDPIETKLGIGMYVM